MAELHRIDGEHEVLRADVQALAGKLDQTSERVDDLRVEVIGLHGSVKSLAEHVKPNAELQRELFEKLNVVALTQARMEEHQAPVEDLLRDHEERLRKGADAFQDHDRRIRENQSELTFIRRLSKTSWTVLLLVVGALITAFMRTFGH